MNALIGKGPPPYCDMSQYFFEDAMKNLINTPTINTSANEVN